MFASSSTFLAYMAIQKHIQFLTRKTFIWHVTLDNGSVRFERDKTEPLKFFAT